MDKQLAGKLLAFNKKVGAIKKDSENPFFHSKYFDVNKVIEVIRPILSDIGLIVLQPLVSIVNATTPVAGIKTIIIDSDTGSEFSEYTPITDLPKAQEMGSAITYWRRYALVSMLLLQGEQDDDGNVASSATPKYPSKPTGTMVQTEKKKVIPTPTIDNKDLPW